MLLKQQAAHIGTLAREADAYLQNYFNKFDSVAKAKNAPAYLINGINHLKPLVLLGVATRLEGKSVPPLGTRRFGQVSYQYYRG